MYRDKIEPRTHTIHFGEVESAEHHFAQVAKFHSITKQTVDAYIDKAAEASDPAEVIEIYYQMLESIENDEPILGESTPILAKRPPKVQYLLRFFVVSDELDTEVENYAYKLENETVLYGAAFARIYFVRDISVFILCALYRATPVARYLDAKIKKISGDK